MANKRIARRRFLVAAAVSAMTAGAARVQRRRVSRVPLSGAITSRTLIETSGTKVIAAGTPFRFGLGLRQGDVPAGSSLQLRDSAGNVLAYQADAYNFWPDGSLKYCEVLGYTAQQISAGSSDTISIYAVSGLFNNVLPGGQTAASLLGTYHSSYDLAVQYNGVQSATNQSNIYADGTRNWKADFYTLATDSRWSGYLQLINNGPVCIGWRAWGQPIAQSGNADVHPHLHVIFYLWLWLNNDGSIRDIEYMVCNLNSLATQSATGQAYWNGSAPLFPPDNYNYDAVLLNGSTVIAQSPYIGGSDQTMRLHHGGYATLNQPLSNGAMTVVLNNSATTGGPGFAPGGYMMCTFVSGNVTDGSQAQISARTIGATTTTLTISSWPGGAHPAGDVVQANGGVGPWSGWWCARADSKPRWLLNPSMGQNLMIRPDPLSSATPQGTFGTVARRYLTGTGLLPRWGVAEATATDQSSNVGLFLSYSPLSKGLWINQGDQPLQSGNWWNAASTAIAGAGAASWDAFFPLWEGSDFYLQTATLAQNSRLSTLGYFSLPYVVFDTNGRIPNYSNTSYAGMVPPKPLNYFYGGTLYGGLVGWYSASGNSPTQVPQNTTIAQNGWVSEFDTSHYPNQGYYQYLLNGYAYNRDIMLVMAAGVLGRRTPDFTSYPNGNGPIGQGSPHGPNSSDDANRSPIIGSTQYFGNVLVTNSARCDGFGLRAIMLPANIAPFGLADDPNYGTPSAGNFGELAYLEGCLRNSINFFHDFITNYYPTATINAGLYYESATSYQFPPNNTTNTGDNWAMSQLHGVQGPWQNMYGWMPALSMAYKVHGVLLGSNLAPVIQFRRRYCTGLLSMCGCSFFSSIYQIWCYDLVNQRQFTSWSQCAAESLPGGASGQACFVTFDDPAGQWLRIMRRDVDVPIWVECPFGVGAKIQLFNAELSWAGISPPSAFSYNTIYRVVAANMGTQVSGTQVTAGQIQVCLDSDPTNTPVRYTYDGSHNWPNGTNFGVSAASSCPANNAIYTAYDGILGTGFQGNMGLGFQAYGAMLLMSLRGFLDILPSSDPDYATALSAEADLTTRCVTGNGGNLVVGLGATNYVTVD